MFNWLKSILNAKHHASRAAPKDLVSLHRDDVEHLFRDRHKLPHVDWGMADIWIDRREPDLDRQPALRRAVAAAWLDAVRDALEPDMRRWRHAFVEGLAPAEDAIAQRVAKSADRSVQVVAEAMRPLTGKRPVETVAVIGLPRRDDYYSFIAPFYPDEGEFATSGGVYIHSPGGGMPLIAMPLHEGRDLELVVAHEMTHHILSPLNLPRWLEEGLTQMMEERVVGVANFILTTDKAERHRAHWNTASLTRYWNGESFSWSKGDEQELAYNLSQAIVRRLLADRPKDFFRFALKSSGTRTGASAAREVLGMDLNELPGQLVAR